MLPPLPKLSEYSVSPETGFLPEEEPLSHLPDAYYQPWETIIQNLQALILAKRIRQVVDRMPLLSVDRLRTEREWRRAYVILGFLTHSYIWGGERPADRLPRVLSVPLIQLSTKLELPPIATYAGLCLWNFRAIFPNEPIDLLENLATLHTFTGSLDESWFYLVSVAIEARGAPIIPIMLHAINAARVGDSDMVLSCLEMFSERLDELSELLVRMYENCDPHVFYFRIRPFLAGSKNMADAGLPNGVMFEDESGRVEYREYSGGSNAQSSLIQAFDILLGIEHRPTGDKKGQDNLPGTAPPSKHNFIQDMRSYMPGPHRRFLEHLTTVSNIKDYVEAHAAEDPALAHAYDTTLHALRTFRDKHIQIVSRYIIIPAREKHKSTLVTTSRPTTAKPTDPSALKKTSNTSASIASNKGLAGVDASKKGFRGTGGTALIPFLKQARDETTENAVGDWAKRTASPIRKDKKDEKTEQEKFMCGLAGMWLSGGEMGGLCSF